MTNMLKVFEFGSQNLEWQAAIGQGQHLSFHLEKHPPAADTVHGCQFGDWEKIGI